jgi:ribosomal protein S18 acetylase RimI-like enzyme
LCRATAVSSWSASLALHSRIEDAGLNASATPQQLWVDGWLLRFSPGKAKRARCVNALAPGRTGFDQRLAWIEAFYARAELPLVFRITPFSQPATLDAELASRGLVKRDSTHVMVCADVRGVLSAAPIAPVVPVVPVPGYVIQSLGAQAFVQAVGRLRGSTLQQQQAHAQRQELSPLAWRAFVVRRASDGQVVAAAQLALEADLAGVYDVVTADAARGLGLGTWLCRHMLAEAVREGATTAYLQVEADNLGARRIYSRLGFVGAYNYHYRVRPEVLLKEN